MARLAQLDEVRVDAPAVVVDSGSGNVRAGFAGEDRPREVFPNIIGVPKWESAGAWIKRRGGAGFAGFSSDRFVGDQAQAMRGIMRIQHPMERGIITNWDIMQDIWHHTCFNELRVAPEDHPVLLTEVPMNPRGNREEMTQIMFEVFSVPAMVVWQSAELSLYSVSRTTGIVLECGDGAAHAVPVLNGFSASQAVQCMDVAGGDLTDWMVRLLFEQCYRFNTKAERDIVRDIKEKLAYVALDLDQEMSCAEAGATLESDYKLPDGQVITLGSARFRCPEALFKPHLMGLEGDGVHEALHLGITKCGSSEQKELFANVVLSGGTTMCKGIADRLSKELTNLAPGSMKVNVVASPDRQYAAWIGGSILASLSSQKIWITKEEYDERGPGVVCRPRHH